MSTGFRPIVSHGRAGSDADGRGGGGVRHISFTEDDVGTMSEDLSEDGAYRSAGGVPFDGPAVWTDVDQEEV